MINTPTYYLVASLLSQNGFGSLRTDIFGGEWGRCDEQILVIEGIGTPADPKELYENPSVQILVRGDKRQASHEVYATAKNISDFMLTLPDSVDIDGVCYTGFEEASNIAQLGKDDNERFIYSMNFSTFRKKTLTE